MRLFYILLIKLKTLGNLTNAIIKSITTLKNLCENSKFNFLNTYKNYKIIYSKVIQNAKRSGLHNEDFISISLNKNKNYVVYY